MALNQMANIGVYRKLCRKEVNFAVYDILLYWEVGVNIGA